MPGRGLFAVLAPPPGSPIGLDKLLVAGVPFTRAGQVAVLFVLVLFVLLADLGKPPTPLAPAVECCCVPQGTHAGDLPKLNFSMVAKPDTCADLGRSQNPPVALQEAFAECAPLAAPAVNTPSGLVAEEAAPKPAGRPRNHGTRNAAG